MQLVESGADPDVRFSAWMAVSRMLTTRASPDRRLQGTGGQRRLRGKAAHRGRREPPASWLVYRGA